MEQEPVTSSTSSRRYDGSRRQAEARARRRRVIDAARQLFLDSGFGETSIQRVAEEAEVSVQTVYAVFGSKAGILGAVIDVAVGGDDEDILVRERPEVAWVAEERDPAQWLGHMAHFIRQSHERAADVLLLLDSVSGSDPALADLAETLAAGRRSDGLFAVETGPLDPAARGLTAAEAADILTVLASVWGWQEMVGRSGWSHDQYEAWLRGAFEQAFLPAGAASAVGPGAPTS